MNVVRILSKRAGRLATFLTVVSLVVLVDQSTKAAVRFVAPLGSPARPLVPGLLDLWHVENTGAAFSIGQGASVVFIMFALAVLIGSAWWVMCERLPLRLVVSVASVAGGGVGNMVDRLSTGSVTDFLSLHFIDFPVFNVADICVTLGVIVAFILYITWDGQRTSTSFKEDLDIVDTATEPHKEVAKSDLRQNNA
ncbi:signal peptidase II [Coriobacteriaceae bacterium BV3Ac1]|uniref:signal peptidase II n=1 Tax=Olegusella massiliensis TaxID=1776381 RepID=UPI0003ADDF97|nr:signal peptidase II [Olegusella massiliensis]ERL12715.1 signal peptidase II [Coriobacteriaceae bacterium BV3Ac1]MBS5865334.1 signal peptidase II [Coriobacteriaceae bacterium]